MIDYANITVKAGKGGDGSGSEHSIKGKRHGKADGGDGGPGGDVYLVVTTDLNTLEPYRFVKDYQAGNGVSGLANLRRGARGSDLELKVPPGTQVKVTDAEGVDSGVYDLLELGQKVLVARGGQAGRGNAHLRDEFGRRPRVGEKGKDGEFFNLTLELKLLAQIGLIGLPNAGKSTLLTVLTAARPKIAAYPFTTLEPNLGVMDTGSVSRRIVIADIPGLIEGASGGKGLGDLFLRHVERTKLLVHLIDVNSADPWGDYQVIRGELKEYSKDLGKKNEIVVLTKIDLADAAKLDEVAGVFKGHREKNIFISAQTGQNLDELKKILLKATG